MDEKQQPRGILKRKAEAEKPVPVAVGLMPPGEKGLTWDEDTLAEHDRQRGGKTKITEPKTPYEYGSEDDEAEGEEMKEAMVGWRAEPAAGPRDRGQHFPERTHLQARQGRGAGRSRPR